MSGSISELFPGKAPGYFRGTTPGYARMHVRGICQNMCKLLLTASPGYFRECPRYVSLINLGISEKPWGISRCISGRLTRIIPVDIRGYCLGSSGNISGLLPGVSARYFREYLRNSGSRISPGYARSISGLRSGASPVHSRE